jgi:hypothetical protein
MKVFLLLFLFSSLSFAGAPSIYSIGELSIAFAEVDGLKVNRGCLEKKCLALERGRKFRTSKVSKKDLDGGKNPHAVKCKTLLGGEVVIGLDRRGNQQSFCQFSDQSYLLNSF